MWAPPVTANTPPIISEVQPGEFANFLPASTQLTFKADDDKTLTDDGFSVTLNGTVYTTANGLNVSGAGKSRTVTLGGLKANENYSALLQVVDSDKATNAVPLYFDTFLAEDLIIESEAYNFDGGAFIDSAALIPEGTGPQSDAYANQFGVRHIDYSDTRQDHRDVPYRPGDSVRMQRSLDIQRQNYLDAGGTESGIYDYDVGDIVSGEWLNYTRNFAPGSYEVYLREANVNLAQGECVLEKVTGDSSMPDQTTSPLGSFLGKLTGFRYRNFPLTDGLGKKVIVRLTGTETLRLHQLTSDPSDGGIYQNYMIFVPVADPGLQRATVASVAPAAGSTVETVRPTLSATIQNRDTVVKEETIVLKLNGQVVPHTTASTGNGVTVSFDISPLPPSGALNTASVSFKDNFNVSQTSEWTFTVVYKSLNPANRSTGPGLDRGICLRMAQGDPAAVPHENSLMQAEDILAGRYPLVMDTNAVVQVVNQSKRLTDSSGLFPEDQVVPGLFDENLTSFGNGDSDFAVEMVTWLELAPGLYRFGGRTDDGFKCSSGSSLHDLSAAGILGFWNGGPADQPARSEFEFVVTAAGFYPFRFMWYERGGSAYGEWYSVDLTTGDRTLINDPEKENSIKAYKTVVSLTLQSSPAVGGPYADDLTAVIDSGAKQVTVPKNGNTRFYRLRSGTAVQITRVEIVGNNVVLHYE